MITQLEIDGFKTFRGMTLELAPFQLIAGANDVGKSNLFDALDLLAHLADADLQSALETPRGSGLYLFTSDAQGEAAETIRLAVEMLVDPRIEDDWGTAADVRYTRMRYELEIGRRVDDGGRVRFAVQHEDLSPIQRSDDPWARRYIGRGRERWLPTLKTGRTVPFISTSNDGSVATVHLHQDGRGGGIATVAQEASRTVLSTIANAEFPHAFAAREEMRSWRLFRLQSTSAPLAAGLASRNGYSSAASHIAPDGGNIGPALARMQWESPRLLDGIAERLRWALPEIAAIEVEEEGGHRNYNVRLVYADGTGRDLAMLASSTVRLVTLAVLATDPNAGGVLLFDEPADALDLATCRGAARLLQAMSTNLEEPGAERLRQAIVVTRSAALISETQRLLTEGTDEPVHELRQIVVAKRGTTHLTETQRLRPSQQLELPLDIVPVEATITMAEVHGLLAE